jgi:hypothetical protein
MLTGQIWLGGLLYERDPAGRLVYSPARLQLLVVTIAGAVQYLLEFIQKSDELPGLSNSMLEGLGGSQLFYLACKGWAAYQAVKNKV